MGTLCPVSWELISTIEGRGRVPLEIRSTIAGRGRGGGGADSKVGQDHYMKLKNYRQNIQKYFQRVGGVLRK